MALCYKFSLICLKIPKLEDLPFLCALDVSPSKTIKSDVILKNIHNYVTKNLGEGKHTFFSSENTVLEP